MATPTFPYTPDFVSSYTTRPRVKTTRLGDGFTYRLPVGLRPQIRSRRIRFEVIELEEIEPIVRFLEERGGHESFFWTPPPPDNKTGLWVAPSWNVRRQRGPLYDLDIVLEEE